MKLEELADRERQVFLSIVQSFIQTAEPVGSRYLCKHYHMDISPATIRNVMTDLEEKGLICQPHTSAGRIPTDIGYRQYVDSLMGAVKLTDDAKRSIVEQLAKFSEDIDIIVERASRVLSDISSQLGLVLSPRFTKGRLDKIDLISMADNKLMVILTIKSGLVKTIVVEIDQEVSQSLLEATEQILNERLHGLSIEELQQSIDERFRDVDLSSRLILNAIREKSDTILSPDASYGFHFAGMKNVIAHPEFETKEKIGKIIELMDRKDILVRVLSNQNTAGVSIVIGEENKESLMKNCSLIAATYQTDDVRGTLGVIGPTRMEYTKIIALVEFMAEALGYLMSKKKK
jgi:heat-inducible transcriptional repressor